MIQPSDSAIIIFLSLVIAFVALVGFLIARTSGPGETDLENGESPRWWPHKWQRLFWLFSPFLLTIGAIHWGEAYRLNTGPLWGFFFALVIIQAVVGGMFGFSFDLVGSIVCGVFISVEVFILGAIVLLGMLDHSRFLGVYLVLGIVAISAGAILAAWLGAMPARRGRGK